LYSGTLLYAGSGNSGAAGIFLQSWDGAAWTRLGGAITGTAIRAIYRIGTRVLVGGEWTALDAGGITADNFGEWNGSAWVDRGDVKLNAGGGSIRAFTAIDTTLYLTGYFETAGGVACSNIASFATGSNAFSAMGVGVNAIGYCLTTDGITVTVGGDFTAAGGITVGRLAIWTGSDFYTLGTGLNNTVAAVALVNDDYYVGGDFTTAGDKSALYAAAYLTSIESVNKFLENAAHTSFDMAGAIHAATAKTAFVDADEIGFWDSVSSGLRKITWANTKATLKTYFDTIYATATNINESKKRSWFL
jgi:hypothetical protein